MVTFIPNTNPDICRLVAISNERVIELPVVAWLILPDANDKRQRHYGEPVGVRRQFVPDGPIDAPWCLFDRVQQIVVDDWVVPAGTGRDAAVKALLAKRASSAAPPARQAA